MGIGEPFDNFENVMEFIEKTDIGARKISVSTCGLPDKIRQFADYGLGVNLCISLHAPNDIIRQKIMPIARRYSIDQVFDAVKYFFEKTKRRVIFEYSLIDGVNCLPEHARELAQRVKSARISYHINLINLNSFNRDFRAPTRAVAMQFMDILIKQGVSCTMRKGKGTDILAACGQLRHDVEHRTAEVSISLDPVFADPDGDIKAYLSAINGIEGISMHLDIMRASMVGHDRCSDAHAEYVLQNSVRPVDVHYMGRDVLDIDFSRARSVCTHPSTAIDLDVAVPNLDGVTVVTVMLVKAGKSGQVTQVKALEKIKKIRRKYPDIRIIADGGINAENIRTVRDAGADVLVVGSAVYPSDKGDVQARLVQSVAGLVDILRTQ